ERAAVVQFAFGEDGAAVGKDDVLGDGEPEAGASAIARASFVDAIEAFEETTEVLGGDARAKIANVELHSVIDIARAEFDPLALIGVLAGIVNEVGEDLENRVAIGGDGFERR